MHFFLIQIDQIRNPAEKTRRHVVTSVFIDLASQ